jgi:hypothetical protein
VPLAVDFGDIDAGVSSSLDENVVEADLGLGFLVPLLSHFGDIVHGDLGLQIVVRDGGLRLQESRSNDLSDIGDWNVSVLSCA